MKILVTVKTLSKKESVEKKDDNCFVVKVKEAPIKGLANKAILKALSVYFKVNSANIKLISGVTSKNKIFKIEK